MKKVVYLINSLKNGGPVNMLYALIKYIDREAYDVYLIALKECTTNQRDFTNLYCKIFTVNEKSLIKKIQVVQNLIDKIKPDIVHSHGGIADVVNVELKGAYISFSTVHCNPDEDFAMKKGKVLGWIKATSFIHIMKKINYPVACSETVSTKIANKRGIRIDYVRNGIDLERMTTSSVVVTREQIGISDDSIVLVFCGYLSALKNVCFIANAFSKISREDITFLVLGNGTQLENLQQFSKNDKRIVTVGRVSDAYPYLRNADYFISASLSEGLPLAAMEGMACGLPLLLSNIDSHQELKQRCPKGVHIFDLSNYEELTELLNGLSKPLEVEKNTVRQTVLKELNAKKMAEKYMCLYQDKKNWEDITRGEVDI